MTTSAERMRALRERQHRGIRRLTIDVSGGRSPRDCETRLRRRRDQRPRPAGASGRPVPQRRSSANLTALTIAEAERHDCLPRPHGLISGQMTSYAVSNGVAAPCDDVTYPVTPSLLGRKIVLGWRRSGRGPAGTWVSTQRHCVLQLQEQRLRESRLLRCGICKGEHPAAIAYFSFTHIAFEKDSVLVPSV